MSDNDVDFKVALAQSWKMEVQNEIGLVERVLKEVANECQTVPGEDDTIMQGIAEVGAVVSAGWDNLFKGFRGIIEATGNIIEVVKKGIVDSHNEWVEVKNSYHN